MRGQMIHYNKIGHEINRSLAGRFPDSDREVFCKKNNAVMVPKDTDCKRCPYFNGFMGGYGIECIWDDVFPAGSGSMLIEHKDRYKELQRVNKLIAAGELKKG